jgi:two-component system response regulator AtoC
VRSSGSPEETYRPRTVTLIRGAPGGGERLAMIVVLPTGIREYELPWPEPCDIGRTTSAAVYIDHPSVSRSHACLTQGGDGPLLRDLGSRNGTYVNNEPIGPAGTKVLLGDALRFGSISAQVVLRSRPADRARLVVADELDAQLAIEAERSARFDRPLSFLSLEIPKGADSLLSLVPRSVIPAVHAPDLLTLRGPGRVDVLMSECSKEEALRTAERIHQALGALEIVARIGVATLPDDATSPEGLPLSAQQAMRSVLGSGVGAVEQAVRVLRLSGREILVCEPAMREIYRLAERTAGLTMPVLVTGETGSGKEIVSEALHALGPRAAMPLVKLNCAAVPENLLESELFGHERGAFSGATAAKPGLIERAHGGTLFLDEIGEMPLALQAKLLRVVEDHLVLRLGATKERSVDVRFVAATHRDLKVAVAERCFREDLFYRLATLQLKIPPLRERRREISHLARRFAAEAAEAAGRGVPRISVEAMAALERYAWPGNIRELRNVLSQAVVFCEGDSIGMEHLPSEITDRAPPAEPPLGALSATAPRPAPMQTQSLRLGDEIRELERARILEALEASLGNQTKAAERLGMPRRTLVSRMAALGIPGRQQRGRG